MIYPANSQKFYIQGVSHTERNPLVFTIKLRSWSFIITIYHREVHWSKKPFFPDWTSVPKHAVLRDSLTNTMAEYYENAPKCFPLSDLFFSGGKSAICHCTIEVVSAWRVLQPLLHAKKYILKTFFKK